MSLTRMMVSLAYVGIALNVLAVPPLANGKVAPVPAEELHVRKGAGNFIAKLDAGKPVTVAYLGGSITAMEGWRNMTTDWLRRTWPKAKVTEVHAAIGGTGSGLGVFRLGHDALSQNPDLLFVEFATNDDGVLAEAIWRNFDGIVQQTWSKNPETDIVFAYTITSPMMRNYGAGKMNDAASAMEHLADHYGIPSVCFGPRVAAEVKAGRLVMRLGEVPTAVPMETPDRDRLIGEELKKRGQVLFAKDGVHPALPGHGFYLKSVVAAFEAMRALPPADHAAFLGKPFFDGKYAAAKMVPVAPWMTRGAGWTKLAPDEPEQKSFSRRGGQFYRADRPGARLRFRFCGTKCCVYDLLAPKGANIRVTVDGKVTRASCPRFDSYCWYTRLGEFSIYEGAGGEHSVELEVLEEQPDRAQVKREDTKTPKYDGTWFQPCQIMVVGDVVLSESPRLGDVRLEGAVAKKMAALFSERVFGAEARGKIYDETVEAFRTHYDDVHPSYGWSGSKSLPEGLWQGEYWGKTMLSSAVVGEMLRDEALLRDLKDRAERFVREFQRADGYLSSYANADFVGGPTTNGVEIFCWNVWGQKYTMWALLELARATSSLELLSAARRMADGLIARLDRLGVGIEETGYFVGLPSMSVLKPMLLLYEQTKDERYRAFARKIVRQWDRADGKAPNLVANAFCGKPYHAWYPNPGRWAKAYETMSCLEGLVAYAVLERDDRVLSAVRQIVGKLGTHELNAVGGVGFFDHFTNAAACPNATTEPCDVTHWIRVNRELFLATDDVRCVDALEFAFYNAFLAGVYRDGKWGAHSVRSHGTRHRTAPHHAGIPSCLRAASAGEVKASGRKAG